jgi:hypothetical protein
LPNPLSADTREVVATGAIDPESKWAEAATPAWLGLTALGAGKAARAA